MNSNSNKKNYLNAYLYEYKKRMIEKNNNKRLSSSLLLEPHLYPIQYSAVPGFRQPTSGFNDFYFYEQKVGKEVMKIALDKTVYSNFTNTEIIESVVNGLSSNDIIYYKAQTDIFMSTNNDDFSALNPFIEYLGPIGNCNCGPVLQFRLILEKRERMLEEKFLHNNKIPAKKVRKFPNICNFIIINSFILCLVFSFIVNIVSNFMGIFVII